MTYEALRLKIRNKIIIPLTYKHRRKKIQNDSFTIISNNCWGGTVYESYGLQKQSPTVGMFFMASDYIRFLSDIKKYLSVEMEFIQPDQSKWKEILKNKKNWGTYPIARLDDIELHLLHYHCSYEEIKEIWKRRIARINWNRMLVKFNDQNGCTQKELESFFKLSYKNKLFFTCKDSKSCKQKYGKWYIVIKQPKRYDSIMASYEPFGESRYCDVTNVINCMGEEN